MGRGEAKAEFLRNVIGKAAEILPRSLWRKERFARLRGRHCHEYMRAIAKRGAEVTNAKRKVA